MSAALQELPPAGAARGTHGARRKSPIRHSPPRAASARAPPALIRLSSPRFRFTPTTL